MSRHSVHFMDGMPEVQFCNTGYLQIIKFPEKEERNQTGWSQSILNQLKVMITDQEKEQLHDLLARHLSAGEADWLNQSKEIAGNNFGGQDFYLRYGRVYKHIECRPLDAAPPYRVLQDTRQLARVYLLLSHNADEQVLSTAVERLFETGNNAELITLYKALSLFPHPEKYVPRAAEGVRSNVLGVYDAIALDNPYPARYLPEPPFNQLVLKGIFNERPIYKIEDLDQRLNKSLADTAIDYMNERWSAGRAVTPEIWRLLSGHDLSGNADLIAQGLNTENPLQIDAISNLLLHAGEKTLKEKFGAKVNPEPLSWKAIGQKIHG